MNSITLDWLETYRTSKSKSQNLADSVFWRLALHSLPRGVDPKHPEVQAALKDIKESVERRENQQK
jgi:hypothetical protein